MTLKATLDVCRWLKVEVRRRGLKHSSRLAVAHAIGHMIDARGECWPSLDTLAKDAMVGKRTVQRALDDLERVGLVTRHRRGGGMYGAGGRGVTTVYGLTGFAVLLAKHRAELAERRRKEGHGVTNGHRKEGHGDHGTVRSSFNGKIGSSELARNVNGEPSEPDRDPNTIDLDEVLEQFDRDWGRALEGGYRGLGQPGPVRAFLRGLDAGAGATAGED